MKVYNFKGAKSPLKVDNKVYSIAQLSVCDSFANWIQQSYFPKGGLGDVRRTVSEKLGLYNQHTASLPPSYGAYSVTYTDLKYNSAHKLERVSTNGSYWNVIANGVKGWPVNDLNTPSQYYFTMPSFESSEDNPAKTRIEQDISGNERIKPYIFFWLKNLAVGGGTENVLLCRDNKSPFIKLTKGEYLNLVAAAIPRRYEEEKKKIYEQNAGNQKSIDYFMSYLNAKYEKRKTTLGNNQEKYKNRLTEIAEVFTAQPDIMFENYPDIFDGNGNSANKFAVYKIDHSMAELCKKDSPQWILISWMWHPNNPVEKYLHESILNNFNFDYVYNFFFAPEKIKGQSYKRAGNK